MKNENILELDAEAKKKYLLEKMVSYFVLRSDLSLRLIGEINYNFFPACIRVQMAFKFIYIGCVRVCLHDFEFISP